jgi:hypothetical protein
MQDGRLKLTGKTYGYENGKLKAYSIGAKTYEQGTSASDVEKIWKETLLFIKSNNDAAKLENRDLFYSPEDVFQFQQGLIQKYGDQ